MNDNYIKELEEENKKLNTRLENAKNYFYEQKKEIEMLEKRTKVTMARNLQKTRDEIYTIGNALHDYALALSEKSTAKMTLVEVNNLQFYLNEIILNLQENGLWDEDVDVRPDLSHV